MVTVLLAHADLAEPTVALGNGFTVTTTGDEVPAQPLLSTTDTV